MSNIRDVYEKLGVGYGDKKGGAKTKSSKMQDDDGWGAPLYKSGSCAHAPLDVGGGKVIHGGSCLHPAVECDVHVGFSTMMRTGVAVPWEGRTEVLFPITDFAAPKDPEAFAKLVSWVSDQLDAGRSVHAGCHGGHGRTGTFLVALCAHRGVPGPFTHVRATYCKKAVESAEQCAFLKKHWGVANATPRDYGNGGRKTVSTSTRTSGSSASITGAKLSAGSMWAYPEMLGHMHAQTSDAGSMGASVWGRSVRRVTRNGV